MTNHDDLTRPWRWLPRQKIHGAIPRAPLGEFFCQDSDPLEWSVHQGRVAFFTVRAIHEPKGARPLGFFFHGAKSPPENPHEKCQEGADDQAGNNRKVKAKVVA